MENPITYESVLALIEQQSIIFNQNLEIGIKKSRKEYEEKLESERQERKKSRQEFEERLEREQQEREKSRQEFNKKLGEITGTWGKLVTEMVHPKIIEMFQSRGIEIEMSAQSVKGFKDGNVFYEIDILLVNTNVAVAVEVKSTLTRQDVEDHLARLDKIKQIAPKLFNLSGMTVYGAVAGMIIENNADRFAYQNGLYVLKQNGNIVEIVNNDQFEPREWRVDY